MAQFKVLSQHLPVGTKENHEKSQSGLLVSRLRFERRISRSRSQILAKYKTSISIMFNLYSSFYRLLQIKTTVLLQYTALLGGKAPAVFAHLLWQAEGKVSTDMQDIMY
jgi:hypothetical protein